MSGDKGMNNDYIDAIGKLNSFQSNAAAIKKTVAARAENRLAVASKQLPEMRLYLEHMGYKVSRKGCAVVQCEV